MVSLALRVAGLFLTPLFLGVLIRLCIPHARRDVLALFASTTYLFLLEQLPVAQCVRMHATVALMFVDPFNTYSTWLVVVLFFCTVLARVALPYLIAYRGVWLADRLGWTGLPRTKHFSI